VPGGKGANQAVAAAARLGARVRFVGRVASRGCWQGRTTRRSQAYLRVRTVAPQAEGRDRGPSLGPRFGVGSSRAYPFRRGRRVNPSPEEAAHSQPPSRSIQRDQWPALPLVTAFWLARNLYAAGDDLGENLAREAHAKLLDRVSDLHQAALAYGVGLSLSPFR
jgi:hypothetical protein